MEESNIPNFATKLTNAAALELFANEKTAPQQRREALTALIASKFLPKQADDNDVLCGRHILLRDAISHEDPAHKLLAIAEAIRLAQVVKRWLPDIKRSLDQAFNSPLPPLLLLPEADDRLNVARACALFQRSWLPDYLAQAVAEEERGEKTPAALMEALLSRSESITGVVMALGKHFERIRPTTEIPGDTVSKRLARTLAMLRGAIIESELEAGDDLGRALLKLVQGTLVAVGRPEEEKAKVDLCHEVILTVHDMVRTRISVVAEPTMYEVVRYCRKLFVGLKWPDELNKPLDRLITDVSEALLLLGRQGQCDQALLGQLDVLCKYPERARAVAKELASRHLELPEDVRFWLERGKVRTVRIASDAALESAASNADGVIGLALQAARQTRQASDGLRDRLISCLEMYEPSLVSATAECLDRIKVLAVQVEQAANLRSLELFGTPGDEVEMSAKFYEVVGDNPRQRMIVIQPAVVKTRNDGTMGDVVIKGLVG